MKSFNTQQGQVPDAFEMEIEVKLHAVLVPSNPIDLARINDIRYGRDDVQVDLWLENRRREMRVDLLVHIVQDLTLVDKACCSKDYGYMPPDLLASKAADTADLRFPYLRLAEEDVFGVVP